MLNPNKLRLLVLRLVYEKQSGHIGGSFSLAEIISHLYNNFDLTNSGEKSDKLVLSKGHAVPIVYAALHELGLISDHEFSLFREINSPLQGHPDKLKLKQIHATTGSLGQGLSISIGHAIGMKVKGITKKCFCIIGDGEMQEGQIWESLMLAPKYNLDNLICIVDYNRSQNDDLTDNILSLEPLRTKIESFNWEFLSMDGHNTEEIEFIFNKVSNSTNNKPKFIQANTIKGKGVSFMAENPEWHAKAPTLEEYEQACKELSC